MFLFHVYRLDPKCSTENVEDFLKSNAIDQYQVEKLQSKFPNDYSSFKVAVPEGLQQKFTDPEIWPENVKINRFFRPRGMKPATS